MAEVSIKKEISEEDKLKRRIKTIIKSRFDDFSDNYISNFLERKFNELMLDSLCLFGIFKDKWSTNGINVKEGSLFEKLVQEHIEGELLKYKNPILDKIANVQFSKKEIQNLERYYKACVLERISEVIGNKASEDANKILEKLVNENYIKI